VTFDSALVEEATNRVVAAEKLIERTALQSMTKAELSQIAQEIDIAGCAGMTKAHLGKAPDQVMCRSVASGCLTAGILVPGLRT
jgi:transposase